MVISQRENLRRRSQLVGWLEQHAGLPGWLSAVGGVLDGAVLRWPTGAGPSAAFDYGQAMRFLLSLPDVDWQATGPSTGALLIAASAGSHPSVHRPYET
jgi:hypothetical protein